MSAKPSNIILTGFMGTGKTTVGRALATVLRHTFVDLDDAIEAKAGHAIPEIFARRGETIFRQLERAVCREVARRSALVIATGGGTIIQAGNRVILERTGHLVCLTASPQAILERVGRETHRPLLESGTESRAERIASLLAARAPHYQAVPLQVDTTGLSVSEVVAIIQQRLNVCHPIP